MKDFVIVADSACDLPLEVIKSNDIYYVGLKCLFEGKEYIEDCGISLAYTDFYKGIRESEMPTTSQVDTFQFQAIFEEIAKTNKDILYLSFSSALSGTMSSARLAASYIVEDYPDTKITVLDTKSASLGCGLLVLEACRLKENGESLTSVEEKIKEMIPKLNHIVALDDINYLKRGGRISDTAAAISSILHLKPMVKMNDIGELINYDKVKGRKKAIETLFNEFEERAIDINKQNLIAISHSDCIEDAKLLADMIKEKYDVEILINYIGCVIGSHTGANTIALFFLGKER